MSSISETGESEGGRSLPESGENPQKTDPPKAKAPAEQIAILLQFPRRILLILLAYLLTYPLFGLLRNLVPEDFILANIPGSTSTTSLNQIDWSMSWRTSSPVSELVGERLWNSLLLLLVALVMAFLLSIIPAIIAVLVDALQDRFMPLGAILKGLSRIFVFALGSLPVIALGFLLLAIFVIELDLLPAGGMQNVRSSNLVDTARHSILPTLVIALFPAMLAAQAAAREATLPRTLTNPRRWLVGLLELSAVLLNQIGGLIGALIIVELIFNWPGVGRLAGQALQMRDYPVIFGALRTFAVIILLARLTAETFFWLRRLIEGTGVMLQTDAIVARNKPRMAWTIFAIALLIIPALIFIFGLTSNPDTVLEMDPGNSFSPPSASHVFGTDHLGRDLAARALRGAYNTLATATIAAVLLIIPGGALGSLSGFLANKRTWVYESFADIVMLPSYLLLFVPSLMAAILLSLWLSEATTITLAILIALVLFPRSIRAAQTLWIFAPSNIHLALQIVAGLSALLLASLYAAFALTISVDYLGIGMQPPTPTLGGMLNEFTQVLFRNSSPMLMVILLVAACAFPLYTAADGVIGYFHSKRPQGDLNA